MKKRFLASATAFALILSLLPVASLGAEAPPAEAPPAENSSVATTVEDAILYPSEKSGSLDYNVVYTSEYDSEVKILDSSNSGIDTVEELKTVMGEADAPEDQLGTSIGPRDLGHAVTANLGFDEDGDIAQIEITDVNEGRAMILGVDMVLPMRILLRLSSAMAPTPCICPRYTMPMRLGKF